MPTKFVFEPESWETIGCALSVHRELGPGFMELVYHNAMTVSLVNKEVPFESERRATVWFQGVEVGHHCLDLVVRESIVVELKAVEEFADIHFAQVKSYLRATGLRLGLLINFNATRLQVRRIINKALVPVHGGLSSAFPDSTPSLSEGSGSGFRDSSIDADSRALAP